MGEREPEAEPRQMTQPWQVMVKKSDGWYTVVYGPNSVLDLEDQLIECAARTTNKTGGFTNGAEDPST